MATDRAYSNEVMRNFAYYVVICVFKYLFLGLLTSLFRIGKSVYVNPEDLKAFGNNKDPDKKKLVANDSSVERVRRNHLNDLENIPAFIFLGYFYVLTNPDPISALWHFRIFTFSRILHTISYQLGLQPWRALFHIAGLGVMASMGIQVLRTV